MKRNPAKQSGRSIVDIFWYPISHNPKSNQGTKTSHASKFFSELRRRNVFKVALAYLLVAWLILQVGDVLQPALNRPEWVTSLLAFFLVLGFPPALFFAWALEWTPEGLKLEKQQEGTPAPAASSGRQLDVVIIGLLLIAAIYFFWEARFADEDETPSAQLGAELDQPADTQSAESSGQTEITDRSIAVLPFDTLGEAEPTAFTEGVPQPEEAARRALEIDPDLAEAHLSRAIVLSSAEQADAPGALRSLQRADELRPSFVAAYIWMGWLSLLVGEPEQAVSANERAVELDPLDAVTRAAAGGPDAAQELLSHPESRLSPVSAGLLHAALGEYQEAVAAFGTVEEWGQISNEYLRYFFPDTLGPLRQLAAYDELLRRADLSWGVSTAD